MDRRDSLKSMLVGSLVGGLALNGCKPVEKAAEISESPVPEYGRTPKEKERDKKLAGQQFFSEHELSTIAILCDIILPANDNFGSATDAGVPEFIEFIAKDITRHQIPLRGGLMWLDNRSNKQFNLEFKSCNQKQQLGLVDEIAYPDKATPETEPGVRFFNLMRNLTLTGYYTTRMGLDDLGYKGNMANIWDGVPEEVLKDQGLEYDEEWLAKCVNPDTSNNVAQWDEEGNLIS